MAEILISIFVDLCAVVAVAALTLRVRTLPWYIRLPSATALGWLAVLLAVASHWGLLAATADAAEQAQWLADHNGTPLRKAALFGWAYTLPVVLGTEAIAALVQYARRTTARPVG